MPPERGHFTSMALARKKATTIALEPEMDELQLALVLEQYRTHPRPKVAGIIRRLPERGDEDELYSDRRR